MSKVIVVGAGQWGKNLVKTYYELGVLAGVAEAHEGLRNDLAKQYPDVPLYADYQDVLGMPGVGIVIATPAHTHLPIAKAALLSGHDTYVEKPITLSEKDAQELIDLAEREGKILMVGHLLLYQPAVRKLKGLIEEGAIGELKALYQERSKLGRVRAVENVLWSFGVHDIAVLMYLVGEEPSAVNVSGQRILQADIEDDVYLHLSYPSGVHAHLHTSWLWPEVERRLTAVGTRGMLVYDEIGQTVTLHRKHVDSTLAHRDEGSEIVFRGGESPLLIECDHFLSAMDKHQTPLTDGRSALPVIRVLEEADRLLKAEGEK